MTGAAWLQQLRRDLGQLPKDYLSPSQINMYIRCPLSYYFRYVEGIKLPPSGAMTYGSSIHKAIEYNYSQKVESHTDRPIGEMQEVFAAEFDSRRDNTDWQGDNPDELKDHGVKAIEVYQEEIGVHTQPVMVEQEVSVPVGGITLKGFIDLVDDKRRVRDLKTTSKTPSSIGMQYSIQLTAYSYAYSKTYGQLPAAVGLDFLVKNKTPKCVQLSLEFGELAHARFERLVETVVKCIRNGLFYPNPNNYLCSPKQCGYFEMCMKWR